MECTTIPDVTVQPQHRTALHANMDTGEQFVFNIFFHVIKDDNGNGNDTSLEDIQDAVALLNTSYNQFDIFFKYQGFDEIHNSNYLYVGDNGSSEYQQIMSEGAGTYHKTDAMNIYIAENLHLVYGIASATQTTFFIRRGSLHEGTLQHEMGHILALQHTYQGAGTDNCELVDGSNCLTNGDLICDTNASYRFNPSGADFITGTADDEVIYDGMQCQFNTALGITDCSDTPYVDPQVNNFMAFPSSVYSSIIMGDLVFCRDTFTQGQGQFMRDYIHQQLYVFEQFLPDVRGTIESLYEPFECVVSDEIASVTDDNPGDGMATVCRDVIIHRYQKGFDYIFELSTASSLNFDVFEMPEINKKDASIQTRACDAYIVKIQQTDNYQYEQYKHFIEIAPNFTHLLNRI